MSFTPKSSLCVLTVCLAAGLILFFGSARPAHPCSGFTAHDNEIVLAGQNEDYYAVGEIADDTRTMIKFVPGDQETYGVMLWGFAFHLDGGINDQGLFYDGFTTPEHTVDSTGVLEPTPTMLLEMMQTSQTVHEAVDYLRTYDLSEVFTHGQLFFADRFGDSVVFDGSVVVEATGNYQVVTNFLLHDPDAGYYPCWRYDLMTEMMEDGLELTVGYFASIADAVHQGNFNTVLYTRYTTVAELKEGIVHLYYDLDYTRAITFVLENELADGPKEYWMSDLYEALDEPDASVPDAGEPDGGEVEDGSTDAGLEPQPDGGQPGGGGAGGCGSCSMTTGGVSSVGVANGGGSDAADRFRVMVLLFVLGLGARLSRRA